MGHYLVARIQKPAGLLQWEIAFSDKVALLAQPGTHHKLLLTLAGELHRERLIDCDELAELLELADGALAYPQRPDHLQRFTH